MFAFVCVCAAVHVGTCTGCTRHTQPNRVSCASTNHKLQWSNPSCLFAENGCRGMHQQPQNPAGCAHRAPPLTFTCIVCGLSATRGHAVEGFARGLAWLRTSMCIEKAGSAAKRYHRQPAARAGWSCLQGWLAAAVVDCVEAWGMGTVLLS